MCEVLESKRSSHKSTSFILIVRLLTFLLTALQAASEKHKVPNLFVPYLMDCFMLPFWDYAKVKPFLLRREPACSPPHVMPVCVCTNVKIHRKHGTTSFCSPLRVLHRWVTAPDLPLHYPFLSVCECVPLTSPQLYKTLRGGSDSTYKNTISISIGSSVKKGLWRWQSGLGESCSRVLFCVYVCMHARLPVLHLLNIKLLPSSS